MHVPALRDRRSDIPLLVNWFLDRYAAGGSIQVTFGAMKCLLQYDWPGNVRELENCIERAVALGDGHIIDVGDMPGGIVTAAQMTDRIGLPSTPDATSTDLEDIERVTIQRVFEQVNGDKILAGKMLGISRATLYRKLKRYNIGTRVSMPSAASQALQ